MNAPAPALWHGTAEEQADLEAAIGRHCLCVTGPKDVRVSTCSAHALLHDQRTLDRLLFYRRLRARLVAEESTPGWPAPLREEHP